MNLTDADQKTIRHQFDSYCRKVLRDESCTIKKQFARRGELEVTFSALSEAELNNLYVLDEYLSDSTFFDLLEYRIPIHDERLAEALEELPKEWQDIILLVYFLGMNDREIAERLGMVRRTVQRRRTNTLIALKLKLGERKDEQAAE